jgi:phage tail-like protein
MVVATIEAPRPPARFETETTNGPEILAPYMPAILRRDPFMGNLLSMFDELLRPLLELLDAADCYFDPKLAPMPMVEYLGTWVGEQLLQSWPESAKRRLVGEAAWIHRARGTRAGLKRALELVTGKEVLVTDNTNGLRLDEDATLGINTDLQAPEPHQINIVLRGKRDDIDMDAVNVVIRKLKPAHAVFRVTTTEE